MRITENVYSQHKEVHFDGIEVAAVSKAFASYIEHLESLGNDSSVSAWHKYVAEWGGSTRSTNIHDFTMLLDPLRRYDEETLAAVDEALDTDHDHDTRIANAATRWELGVYAGKIVTQLEQYVTEDES
jgi:hypothetical protein